MGILTTKMKKFVESETKAGFAKDVYYRRIRQYAQSGLKDLALLAEKLPESEIEQIFNVETLKPLFGAIFNTKNMEDQAKKDRILKICHIILDLIGNLTFARKLAPEYVSIILGDKERDSMIAIRSIFLARTERGEY